MKLKTSFVALAAAMVSLASQAATVSNAGGTGYGSAALSGLSGATFSSNVTIGSSDLDGKFDVVGGPSNVTRGVSSNVFYDQVSTPSPFASHFTTISLISGSATSFTGNLNFSPYKEDYGLDGLINGDLSAKPLTFVVYNGVSEVDRFILHDIPAQNFQPGSPFGFAYTTTGGSFTSFRVFASNNDVETYSLGNLAFTMAPVPEPETYAMMLAGLGALGFMARRRRIG